MKSACLLLCFFLLNGCVGCGAGDYYDSYQNASKTIERLEKDLAEAQEQISQAKDALTAEQQAMKRLYIED